MKCFFVGSGTSSKYGGSERFEGGSISRDEIQVVWEQGGDTQRKHGRDEKQEEDVEPNQNKEGKTFQKHT